MWGFTLIELILVATIIIVIAGLSTPLFRRTFSDLRVNLQTKDIASLMNLAREKAIMTRVPHIIKIDAEGKTYRMFTMDSNENKPAPIMGRWGRQFYISNTLKVNSSTDAVKFFPDGSSNGALILLEDASGFKNQIQVNAGTGEITVGKRQGK